MLAVKRVLFPTDFSRCADQAKDHALFIAKEAGAELIMLHAIVLHADDPHDPAHHFDDVDEIRQRLESLARVKMKETVAASGSADLKITLDQVRGLSAADTILNYSADHDIDLIVMGTTGRRGLEHVFLGSVAEEVVRRAHCPVMTVRESRERRSVEDVERILVPVDFSKHSQSALIHAKEIAAVFGARLQLVHFIEETVHPAFYMTGKTSILELRPDILEKAHQALEDLLARSPGADVEAEIHVEEGRAARDIVAFAEREESDLIVIATHGLTGLQHFLLGSVTEKVVRRAPCPVFTVKSFGKSLITRG